MKYLNKFVSSVLLAFISCAMGNQSSNEQFVKLEGTWISQEDNRWRLIFKGNKLIEIYDKELEECVFSVSKESCNKKYSSSEAIYLKYSCEEDMCVEIVGLTNTVLSYRDTSTGKLHKFEKNK